MSFMATKLALESEVAPKGMALQKSITRNPAFSYSVTEFFELLEELCEHVELLSSLVMATFLPSSFVLLQPRRSWNSWSSRWRHGLRRP